MSEVERSWFRVRSAGEQLAHIYCSEGNEDGDFDDVEQADAEADHAIYLAEIEAARQAVAEVSLEHEFPGRLSPAISVRWVYLHMIEEYARHNGHDDLLRERIDGVTGD